MDRMSFVQRLTTLVYDPLMLFLYQNMTTTYVDRLAPGRPSLNAIQLLQRVGLHYNKYHRNVDPSRKHHMSLVSCISFWSVVFYRVTACIATHGLSLRIL